MRVLLAGASGAIGVPLTRALVTAGHDVIGITRGNASRLRETGAEPVIADAMDRGALLHALKGVKADAVMHQMTALTKPPVFYRDIEPTNRLRIEGTANLLAAAEQVGASRFVTQSIVFGYGYGDWGDTVLTEESPFGPPGRTRGLERAIAAMRATEEQARALGGIAMRYGVFYGPGASEPLVRMMRWRMLPVPRGDGITPLIHVDDAASATVLALEQGQPGSAYNVVDDEPVRLRDFLTALAVAAGAPKPFALSERLLPSWTYAREFFSLRMRVSNAKARSELGWTLSAPSYRDGLRLLRRA